VKLEHMESAQTWYERLLEVRGQLEAVKTAKGFDVRVLNALGQKIYSPTLDTATTEAVRAVLAKHHEEEEEEVLIELAALGIDVGDLKTCESK